MKPLCAAACAAILGAVLATTPAAADENYCVTAGAFSPQGPADLGTFLGFNIGSRISDQVRIAGEVDWYRRDYESSFLLVQDPAAGTGSTVFSIASTHLFPFLGTVDYYHPIGSGDLELFAGAGAGFDVMRTKHFPRTNLPTFTSTHTGLSYMFRGGVSTPGFGGTGAVHFEGFWKGSSIDGEGDDLVAGRGADVEARASGFGFRIGFRW